MRTHFQLSATRGLTKFVGRERELEQMRRAFEMARTGRGQLVAVVAEAGTGKSRLLHEFKAALAPQCRVLEAYSVSHGKNSPYLPILDLLNGYFGLTDNDDQKRRREKIAMQLTAIDPGLSDIVPYLYSLMRIVEDADPLSQLDSRLRRQRTLEAFKRIVIGESLKQPLVVIFEDLHWVDEETQEALNLLVDGIRNARVLLLVNYRPEYRHTWGNRSHYIQLRLDPLEAGDAEAMLDALLGENPDLRALKLLISEETAGNPFFIEELVQALFGERVLIREDDVIKVTRPLSQVRIPATVQAILASRIDRLPGPMKELVQTISVLGKDFSLELVKAVTPVAEDELSRMLSALQLSEFIYEQPGFTDVAYSFKHALTQEVAYNSVLSERRRRLHERAGEAIEILFAIRLDDHIAELAHHYSRSTNAAKALTYLKSAGELAVRRSANGEAAVVFNSALQILERLPETPERDQQELDLLIELGPALMSIKGFAAAECEAVYRRASDLCRRIGETPRLYTVLWGQWMSRSVQARWDEALDLAHKLLAIANSTEDRELLVEAHHASWNAFTLMGDLAKSEFHVKEGLALYDPAHHGGLFSRFGGHDPGVCAYGHGSINLWLLGNSEQSLTRIREALSLAEQLKNYHTTVRGRAAAAWLFQLRRDPAATAHHAKVAVELASEHGLPFWQAFANLMMGWSLSESGRDSEGIALMRQALAQYRNTGAEEHYSYFLLLLAESLLKQGQVDQSLDLLAQAETVFKSNGERFHESEVYRLQAESLLRQSRSDREAAEGKLRAAVSVSKQQGAKAWQLRTTMSLVRLLSDTARRDEASATLAEIYNRFTEGFDTPDLKDAKALLDELTA